MLPMRGEHTIQQSRYDALPRPGRRRRAAKGGAKEREHVTAREHRRKVIGASGALQALHRGHLQRENAPVQEDEGAKGLVLGGGRAPALHGDTTDRDLTNTGLQRMELRAAAEPLVVGWT